MIFWMKFGLIGLKGIYRDSCFCESQTDYFLKEDWFERPAHHCVFKFVSIDCSPGFRHFPYFLLLATFLLLILDSDLTVVNKDTSCFLPSIRCDSIDPGPGEAQHLGGAGCGDREMCGGPGAWRRRVPHHYQVLSNRPSLLSGYSDRWVTLLITQRTQTRKNFAYNSNDWRGNWESWHFQICCLI